MSVGERLKALRIQKEVSQQELANLLGISVRAWQYYEKDQRELNVSGIVKVSDFFDITSDYLLGRTDKPK
jgi:transcriptional regulator with XRE-family HTH domain